MTEKRAIEIADRMNEIAAKYAETKKQKWFVPKHDKRRGDWFVYERSTAPCRFSPTMEQAFREVPTNI